EEILISNPKAAAIIRPADGGTISSLRSKTAGIELINSLKRRPEAYHRLVSQKSSESATAGGAPASIHDSVHCKESNLGGLLRYDRYARNAFRAYLFPRRKTWHDFDSLALEEHEDLAQGGWEVDRGSDDPSHVKLVSPFAAGKNAQTQVAEKTFKLTATDDAWEIDCALGLSFEGGELMSVGMEIVLNLLAPESHDRYYLAGGLRQPLGFRGEFDRPALTVVDEWQRLEISLDAPESKWWIVPIETISQSESGFERVYQGSALMAVWPESGGTRMVKMRVRGRR
ncbi:MAG: DUF1926 domain-containing protein, partial [Acidobacteriota bacterium]|nr:DUF1926 domain-containing protein [Acidobacteriota bacterium]